MSTAGATGGASTAGEEEMEDDAEMEDDSSSNVPMLAAGGTFIALYSSRPNSSKRAR